MSEAALESIRRLAAIQTLSLYLKTGTWLAKPLSVGSVLEELSGMTGNSYAAHDGRSERERCEAALKDLEEMHAAKKAAGPGAGA